jgi:protoporphyrinogen oxidase
VSGALKDVRYLVLGAGPSGLAFASALEERGETSYLVLEKEEVPGGLCRSEVVDGAPLDIGGGHFLDVARPHVLKFLFRYLPESEWQEHARLARIRLRGREIDHPIEANLWQLPLDAQVDYLESIAASGSVRGLPEPKAFGEWIAWKLGARIADDYMLPYNEKLFGCPLAEFGTYWLEKLPSVSFRETLRSCLERKAFGTLPAHGRFLYPRSGGYGQVWARMGEALGERLLTGTPVQEIDLEQRVVNGRFRAETIVSSIAWPLWPKLTNVPSEVGAAIGQLKHASIDVTYVPENLETDSHWIYEPDPAVPHHRLLARPNFCAGSRGHWTEANAARSLPTASFRHHNDFAYPVNTLGKREALGTVLKWARAQSIVPIGRWGLWEHMNSDVAVAGAMAAAQASC